MTDDAILGVLADAIEPLTLAEISERLGRVIKYDDRPARRQLAELAAAGKITTARAPHQTLFRGNRRPSWTGASVYSLPGRMTKVCKIVRDWERPAVAELPAPKLESGGSTEYAKPANEPAWLTERIEAHAARVATEKEDINARRVTALATEDEIPRLRSHHKRKPDRVVVLVSQHPEVLTMLRERRERMVGRG